MVWHGPSVPNLCGQSWSNGPARHEVTMDTPTVDTSRLHAAFSALGKDLATEIVGQSALIERLLIALLADGHLLVEGAPGLAKTTAIRALASRLDADFARVQFTPDLLPADLTGTEVWRPQDGRFEFLPGPIFHSILLADEINRAPAKVQSALLEAMGERQVTVGRQTYPLPALFMVMATQNPIEQEGTFPLPEAQLDRFLFNVVLDYLAADDELEHRDAAGCQHADQITLEGELGLVAGLRGGAGSRRLVTGLGLRRECGRSQQRQRTNQGEVTQSVQHGVPPQSKRAA